MGKTHTELLQVRMSSELKKALEILALERGKTSSEVVRDMIYEAANRENNDVQLTLNRNVQRLQTEVETLKSVAFTVMGMLGSVRKDLLVLRPEDERVKFNLDSVFRNAVKASPFVEKIFEEERPDGKS